MNIIINISQIAIITNDNPYQSKRDFLIDFWSKYDKNDFNEYKSNINFVKQNDFDIIDKILTKNNIKFNKELNECCQTNNIEDLEKSKDKILDKIDVLTTNEKNEIKKSIKNITNTSFGTRNENDITKIYEDKTGVKIIKDNIYKRKTIIKNNIFSILIGGKIDGINEEKTYIIEIKNRVKNLFYKLREYEKVQIMCYIYLFSVNKGCLIEALKTKTSTNINIIEIYYDENYMNNIIEKLNLFGIFFENFMKNDIKKKNLLLKNDEIEFTI